MSNKLKLEEAAARHFVAAYNRLHGAQFILRKHRDRPDFLATDSNPKRVVGIEITHLYYGSEEAKLLFGKTDEDLVGPVSAEGMIRNLNALLKHKSEQAQKYNFSHPFILVVRVASPVFDIAPFNILSDEIVVPINNFAEIWLLARDEATGSWGALKQLK